METNDSKARWIARVKATPQPAEQIEQFLAARTVQAPASRVRAGDLYREFLAYAEARDWVRELLPTGKAFGTDLTRRYAKHRTKHGVIYAGLLLLPTDPPGS